MILLSFVCALATGNMQNLSDAVSKEIQNATELAIILSAGICFWSGIMKIAINSGLCEKFSKLLSPLVNLIFKDVKSKEGREYIIMNITSNILGLGNAATPYGIKAMEKLQKENKNGDRASNAMCRFVVLNTASIQLIPTTLINLRINKGGIFDEKLLYCIWISSFLSCFLALLLCIICERIKK